MAAGESWRVRKCAASCKGCGKAFEDGERLFSRLWFEEGEYLREDFCAVCWEKERERPALSSWQTVFTVPPPPPEEPVKKESAESLLRRLLARDAEEERNAVFILAVMLERKKVLVERDVQRDERGRKLRIYEHRKTGESFAIVDPELSLSDLEKIQEEVSVLLGAPPASRRGE